MTVDYYAGSGRRWATGAMLVYGPIAAELVSLTPHPLAGRAVLDAGTGTGAASGALERQGARPLAVDSSYDMLAWNAGRRPPAAVGDICALPIADHAVDDGVAAFVLNHLVNPEEGFAELIRVIRPGGALLACVFSAASRSEARDEIDVAARGEGWEVPAWYVGMKDNAVPILGAADAMAQAARAVGLTQVDVDERPVDVGVTEPEQLVDYRFGQAHFAEWLARVGPDRAADVRERAIEAVRPIMQPYTPIVVFLSAIVTTQESRKR